MFFAECLSVSICAWVFFEVLTAPGMVLEFWYKYLERLDGRGMTWIAKPMGLCGQCCAGQWGFWWYAVAYRDAWVLGEHIVFASQTIAGFLLIKTAGKLSTEWSNKLRKG